MIWIAMGEVVQLVGYQYTSMRRTIHRDVIGSHGVAMESVVLLPRGEVNVL